MQQALNNLSATAKQELNERARAVCDCENPEPASGAALVSMECPIHNENPRQRPTEGMP